MFAIELCSYSVTDEDVGEINGLLRELSPKFLNFAVRRGEVQSMLIRSILFLARLDEECADEATAPRGRIVGMATLAFYPKLTGLVGVVEEVAVKKEFRRQGIAEKLMSAVLAEAKEHGTTYLDLTCNPARYAARALYEKFGFVRRETDPFRLTLKNPC